MELCRWSNLSVWIWFILYNLYSGAGKCRCNIWGKGTCKSEGNQYRWRCRKRCCPALCTDTIYRGRTGESFYSASWFWKNRGSWAWRITDSGNWVRSGIYGKLWRKSCKRRWNRGRMGAGFRWLLFHNRKRCAWSIKQCLGGKNRFHRRSDHNYRRWNNWAGKCSDSFSWWR